MDELLAAVERGRMLRNHSKRTFEMDKWHLKTLGKHPAEVTAQDITEVILRNGKQSSRAAYSSQIRSLFQLLREDGLIPADHCPDREVPAVRKPAGQPRPFSPGQMDRLRRDMKQPYRDVVIIASLTGFRASELWALKGSDLVDGLYGPELLVVGKGSKPARIPAHPRVVEVIDSYRTLGRIFTRWSTPQRLSASVSREIRRVLGEDGVLHQCRHSFATEVLAATDNLAVTQQLLRHASPATTMAYAQLASDKGRQAIDLLAG